MKKYIVYEENSLQQVSNEVDTPLDARYLTENFQESAKRYNLKNKKYKRTTNEEFKKKVLLTKFADIYFHQDLCDICEHSTRELEKGECISEWCKEVLEDRLKEVM